MDDRLWLILIILAFAAFFFVSAAVVTTFRYKYGNIPISRPTGRVICIALGTGCVALAFVLGWKQ
jgi:hypothetical protein